MSSRYIISLFMTAVLVISNMPSIVFAENESTIDEGFYSGNDILFYGVDAASKSGSCTELSVSSTGALTNEPDPWRSLIESTAPTYPSADMRLVVNNQEAQFLILGLGLHRGCSFGRAGMAARTGMGDYIGCVFLKEGAIGRKTVKATPSPAGRFSAMREPP